MTVSTTIDTTTVTSEQIGKAHKCFEGSKPFYKVENSDGKLDQDGLLIEYKVTFSLELGYQCTCEAGKHGFAHCKNYCWHVRASVAAAKEEREAMREQDRLNAAQPAAPAEKIYTDVDAKTLARVMRRSEEQARKPVRKPAPLRQGTGFSLLK